jgi:ribosomal protein L32
MNVNPLALVCNPCHGVRFLLFCAGIANPRKRDLAEVSGLRSVGYATLHPRLIKCRPCGTWHHAVTVCPACAGL